jgi:hypothetical protein
MRLQTPTSAEGRNGASHITLIGYRLKPAEKKFDTVAIAATQMLRVE